MYLVLCRAYCVLRETSYEGGEILNGGVTSCTIGLDFTEICDLEMESAGDLTFFDSFYVFLQKRTAFWP